MSPDWLWLVGDFRKWTFHFRCSFTNHFGSTAGLSVALRPLIEKGTISSVFSNGLRVLIHDSRHYVSDATAEKVLQVKSESIIRIYGTETICDDSVRELSVARRNCLFKHERKLRWSQSFRSAMNIFGEIKSLFADFSMIILTRIATRIACSDKFSARADACHTIMPFCPTLVFAISRKSIASCKIIVGQLSAVESNQKDEWMAILFCFRKFPRRPRRIPLPLSTRLRFHVVQYRHKQNKFSATYIRKNEIEHRPILVGVKWNSRFRVHENWYGLISVVAWMTTPLSFIWAMPNKCFEYKSALHWRISSIWQVRKRMAPKNHSRDYFKIKTVYSGCCSKLWRCLQSIRWCERDYATGDYLFRNGPSGSPA